MAWTKFEKKNKQGTGRKPFSSPVATVNAFGNGALGLSFNKTSQPLLGSTKYFDAFVDGKRIGIIANPTGEYKLVKSGTICRTSCTSILRETGYKARDRFCVHVEETAHGDMIVLTPMEVAH